MNNPPPVPFTYELKRWDLLANWMTLIFLNRILQVLLAAVLLMLAAAALNSEAGVYPLPIRLLFELGGFLVFAGILLFVVAWANAFLLKHRGVVGQHVLEITEAGLIERTDYNETLYRWPSVSRIRSFWGYLYIYVSDNNVHQVPKRCFSREEIARLEAELRHRMAVIRR